MNRDLDAEIVEKIFGWQTKMTGPDYDGLNNSEVLVPPTGFRGTYPNRGPVHRGYHAPRYSENLELAISLAKHVKLEMGISQITTAEALAQASLDFWKENHGSYYLVSLSNTKWNDMYLTLWRPDNAGYCYSKGMAGIYSALDKGYHISEHTLPISVFAAQRLDLFDESPFEISHNFENRLMIPNTKAIRDILGIKTSKKEGCLVRKNPKLINAIQ